jgi:hypothetical protein
VKFTVTLPCFHPQPRAYYRMTDIIYLLHRDGAEGMTFASTKIREVVHYE